jgi:FtsZ-interacting cell division protein ZipA
MSSLRWILLLAGLVFLAGLAWWELRRPRQARGEERPGESPRAAPPVTPDDDVLVEQQAPGVQARASIPPVRITDEPLKIVEHSGSRRIEPGISFEIPVLVAASAPAADRHEPGIEPAESAADETPLATAVATPARPAVVVDWPPESERRIVNLRVVPLRAERFGGRALRLALTAAGFEHGRFGIFHLPGPAGRAIVSAASLSRPGILDPDNMDFQHFGGLNLFAVLPGPLQPDATVDRLVNAAGDIAQRLEGRVQDEAGMPLDTRRMESLLRTAMGDATAPGP